MKKILLITIATGVYIFSLITFSNIWKAETSYIKFKNYFLDKQLKKAELFINKAVTKNPNEPRYYYEKAKLEIAKGNFPSTKTNLEQAENLSPNNLVSLRNMVPIYSYLPEQEAKIYYKKLKERYSHDAGVLIQLAKHEKDLELTNMYNETISMIQELRPDLINWAL